MWADPCPAACGTLSPPGAWGWPHGSVGRGGGGIMGAFGNHRTLGNPLDPRELWRPQRPLGTSTGKLYGRRIETPRERMGRPGRTAARLSPCASGESPAGSAHATGDHTGAAGPPPRPWGGPGGSAAGFGGRTGTARETARGRRLKPRDPAIPRTPPGRTRMRSRGRPPEKTQAGRGGMARPPPPAGPAGCVPFREGEIRPGSPSGGIVTPPSPRAPPAARARRLGRRRFVKRAWMRGSAC